jgi:ABC-type branched-subunit amino acid transport system substrate-binding protein
MSPTSEELGTLVHLAATASLLRQFADAGYDGPVLGTYNFALDPVKSEAETAIAGSYITLPAFSNSDPDPFVQRFVAAYRDEFGTAPPWNAAVEFDAIAIITRAISDQDDCSPGSFKKGLESVGDYSGIAGQYRYNAATGEWHAQLSIKQMRDGVPVDVLVGNEM